MTFAPSVLRNARIWAATVCPTVMPSVLSCPTGISVGRHALLLSHRNACNTLKVGAGQAADASVRVTAKAAKARIRVAGMFFGRINHHLDCRHFREGSELIRQYTPASSHSV